ncbi:MAG: homoserine O-acetyltransferase [bacterium]|nr:homoserine O-acetyltransferase [bacterium]
MSHSDAPDEGRGAQSGKSRPVSAPYDSLSVTFREDQPLHLDSGETIAPYTIAYQSYGDLNEDKSNAILICHALTGDQHVANDHPLTGKSGWWDVMVGPGKPVDTDRYFVICSNVIGGCLGSTGPSSPNPVTFKPYGLDFPVITIADMVRAQASLIDYLKIDTLFCVMGGSIGGMQVLEWATSYPNRVKTAIPIATAARHSSQNIGFNEVGRQAIMADPNWHEGRYYDHDESPSKGLAVARMAAHITYLSEEAMQEKFGRNLQDRDKVTFGFDADFQIESYLRYQGFKFVERFDANAYLYITRAVDYFDLAADHAAGGTLADVFKGTKTRFCVVSFTSDWLYPSSEARTIVKALNAVAAKVSFVDITSDKGHDAFLLDEPDFFDAIQGFLSSAAKQAGLEPARTTGEAS